MVSKRLLGFWTALVFSMLAAAGILIAFSIVWRSPNLLNNFTIPSRFLTGGLVLGIAFAVTVAVAIGGIVQQNHITLGLQILNWVLLLDGIGVIAVGSMIWFFSLHERVNYEARFIAASTTVRQELQDHFQCCGYFFPNDTNIIVYAGFCSDMTFALNQTACVTPITAYADYTINNIFTSVYGFMAIVISLFLITVCVINKRIEAERFRKIDLKRGGRGFV